MAQPTHRNPILPPPAIEEYTPAQSLRSAAVNEFWEADRELQDLILSVEATKYRYEFHHKVLHVVTRTSHFQYQVVRGIDGLCTEGVARRRLMSQEREKWTGYMKEVAAVKKRMSGLRRIIAAEDRAAAEKEAALEHEAEEEEEDTVLKHEVLEDDNTLIE